MVNMLERLYNYGIGKYEFFSLIQRTCIERPTTENTRIHISGWFTPRQCIIFSGCANECTDARKNLRVSSTYKKSVQFVILLP
jgi:hypothetical protein